MILKDWGASDSPLWYEVGVTSSHSYAIHADLSKDYYNEGAMDLIT